MKMSVYIDITVLQTLTLLLEASNVNVNMALGTHVCRCMTVDIFFEMVFFLEKNIWHLFVILFDCGLQLL
jgi:hypothetical protein